MQKGGRTPLRIARPLAATAPTALFRQRYGRRFVAQNPACPRHDTALPIFASLSLGTGVVALKTTAGRYDANRLVLAISVLMTAGAVPKGGCARLPTGRRPSC